MSLRYSLAEHVHLCRIGKHILLLDVRRDRYLALPAAATECLVEVVPGWPGVQSQLNIAPGASSQAQMLADQLKQKGILADGGGKSATPVRAERAVSELVSQEAQVAGLGISGVLPILRCLLTAAVISRRFSLEQLVQRVAARKHRHRRNAPQFDFARAQSLIVLFRKLRPYLYTSRNACLFESVALLELLSRWQMFPDWVFGVRASPFGAHCWLQEEGVVVNDTREHVDHFQPIMIV